MFDIGIIFYYYKKDKGFKELMSNMRKIKIDWMLVLIIIVLFISLYSVHYNYTGKMSTVNVAALDVKNAKFIYPYYSDEWISVSLIKYSIDSSSLPLANPLWKYQFFQNFEFASHSFLSLLFLIMGLNPLTHYSALSLFFGILICILVYFILRFNNIEKISAGLASLLTLYITNGVNLPGIWYLLPVTLGIICLLLGYIFISINDKKLSLASSFLILIFYPPLFVFYTLSIIAYFLFLSINKKEKIKYIGIYFGICIMVAILISVFLFILNGYSNTFSLIYNKLFYSTFTQNAIPDYSIWKVLPLPILILSFIGILSNFRKKIIFLIPVIAGLIYWLIYSSVLWRFIIEYQRVVLVTSIFIVIFAGFGLDYLFNYLKEKKYFKEYHIILILQVLILIVLLILSFNYTKMNNWQELKLHDLTVNQYISPNSPATNYLTQEDLMLFKNIKNKTFISSPWKGLVIGAATNNYPIESKSSIITNRIASYSDFMNADCKAKKDFVMIYQVDYVYAPYFNCTSGFEYIDKSTEGLFLYRVV